MMLLYHHTRSLWMSVLVARRWSAPALLVLIAVTESSMGASTAELPADSVTGSGGVVVVMGYDQSPGMDAICRRAGFTVQFLEPDAARAASTNRRMDALNCSTRASAIEWSAGKLPYASNLINAFIVTGRLACEPDEIMRALVPGGRAVVRQSDNRPWLSQVIGPIQSIGKGWVKFTKPVPGEIDDWTHYLYDASGNAVAHDRRVGSPSNVQWCAGVGQMTRDHDGLASLSSMVSCRGKVFYLYDEGPTSSIHLPSKWSLIARDAFNGVVLWKRPVSDWVTSLYFFRSGPTWVPRRLVAVGDRVYVTLGLDAPISVLDAQTGRTISTLPGTENTEEFIVSDGLLLAVTGDPQKANREAADPFLYTEFTIDDKHPVDKQIVACDLAAGKVVWKLDGEDLKTMAPLSLSALGSRIYYLDSRSIHCLNARDGRQLWQEPFETKGLFLRSYAPTVVATEDAVLCLTNTRLAAFAADDGHLLWDKAGYVGFASPGDLFVIDGLVWTLPTVATLDALRPEGGEFLGNDGREFLGIELKTGKVVRRFDRKQVWPSGHHHRCYRNKATDQFFICGRRGVEFIGLQDQGVHHNWWIRGICQYGIMPANGLLYVPPDPCRCFSQIKMDGLLAFTSGDTVPEEPGPALVPGPAYSAPKVDRGSQPSRLAEVESEADRDDWPTYRHDRQRSGATQTRLPAELVNRWRRTFRGPISAVTVSGGAAYLAEIDAHRLQCLDAGTGRAKWSFTAAGRIDSPPTISRGIALFGCRDGWVYAVRASDGVLVWKFRAAPADRFVVEDGQLESSWPVSGSVLVVNGVVYCAAGRSSYLEGGITLYGLDVVTGKVIYERTLDSPEPTESRKSPGQPYAALPAVLCSNGNVIAMRTRRFRMDLAEASRRKGSILAATTGLLNDSWFHRENWSLTSGPFAPWGKLIVFDDERAWGIQNPYTYIKRTPGLWPEGQRGHHHQQYSLYEESRFPRGVRFYSQPLDVDPKIKPKPIASTDRPEFQRWENARESSTEHHLWTYSLPMQVRTMVLAGDTLFAAGWNDQSATTADPVHDSEHTSGIHPTDAPVLYAFNARNGQARKGYQLSARPVFDGMAVAEGKLFIPLNDGTLVCFGSPESN